MAQEHGSDADCRRGLRGVLCGEANHVGDQEDPQPEVEDPHTRQVPSEYAGFDQPSEPGVPRGIGAVCNQLPAGAAVRHISRYAYTAAFTLVVDSADGDAAHHRFEHQQTALAAWAEAVSFLRECGDGGIPCVSVDVEFGGVYRIKNGFS